MHEQCADSLLGVFERLAVVYPDETSRREAEILAYGGLHKYPNPRPYPP